VREDGKEVRGKSKEILGKYPHIKVYQRFPDIRAHGYPHTNALAFAFIQLSSLPDYDIRHQMYHFPLPNITLDFPTPVTFWVMRVSLAAHRGLFYRSTIPFSMFNHPSLIISLNRTIGDRFH
jgi:hypothetical protein